MSEQKSIKRHPSIQPLSRDHHHGLLLSWKIREGLKRNVSIDRIKNYTDWFWDAHLKKHFWEEETYLFPILGNEHPLIKQAISEHRKLSEYFAEQTAAIETLNKIETELDKHIRFEERTLFNEIQNKVTPEHSKELNKIHQDVFCDDWQDEFWKN